MTYSELVVYHKIALMIHVRDLLRHKAVSHSPLDFAALRFQVLGAPGDNRGPKVSAQLSSSVLFLARRLNEKIPQLYLICLTCA